MDMGEIKISSGKNALRNVVSEAVENIYFRREHIEKIVDAVWGANYRKTDELNAEIAGLTGKVEALQQDNENLRRTLAEGAESSATPFERYLLDKLLHSAEDYCAYCANAPADEVCLSENKDDCRAGIRAFYERFVEGK